MKHHCLFVILLTVVLMASCNGRVVYDKYDHTPIAGWEKNDTLLFDVNTVKESGVYSGRLGLRINSAFPFTSLVMIVRRTIIPRNIVIADTVNCKLMDENNGRPKGQGVGYYQYEFPLKDILLEQGDSMHIVIRHNMRREILPGISDVGIEIKKK